MDFGGGGVDEAAITTIRGTGIELATDLDAIFGEVGDKQDFAFGSGDEAARLADAAVVDGQGQEAPAARPT